MVWKAADALELTQVVLASTEMEYIIIVTCDAICYAKGLWAVSP